MPLFRRRPEVEQVPQQDALATVQKRVAELIKKNEKNPFLSGSMRIIMEEYEIIQADQIEDYVTGAPVRPTGAYLSSTFRTKLGLTIKEKTNAAIQKYEKEEIQWRSKQAKTKEKLRRLSKILKELEFFGDFMQLGAQNVGEVQNTYELHEKQTNFISFSVAFVLQTSRDQLYYIPAFSAGKMQDIWNKITTAVESLVRREETENDENPKFSIPRIYFIIEDNYVDKDDAEIVVRYQGETVKTLTRGKDGKLEEKEIVKPNEELIRFKINANMGSVQYSVPGVISETGVTEYRKETLSDDYTLEEFARSVSSRIVDATGGLIVIKPHTIEKVMEKAVFVAQGDLKRELGEFFDKIRANSLIKENKDIFPQMLIYWLESLFPQFIGEQELHELIYQLCKRGYITNRSDLNRLALVLRTGDINKITTLLKTGGLSISGAAGSPGKKPVENELDMLSLTASALEKRAKSTTLDTEGQIVIGSCTPAAMLAGFGGIAPHAPVTLAMALSGVLRFGFLERALSPESVAEFKRISEGQVESILSIAQSEAATRLVLLEAVQKGHENRLLEVTKDKDAIAQKVQDSLRGKDEENLPFLNSGKPKLGKTSPAEETLELEEENPSEPILRGRGPRRRNFAEEIIEGEIE